MEKQEKFWELSAAKLAGEINRQQEEELKRLLSRSNYLQSEFEKMEKEWITFESSARGNFTSSKEAWGNLKNRLEEEGLLEKRKFSFVSNRKFLKIAAAILLFIGLGFSAAYIVKNAFTESNTYFASTGVMNVELSDGSSVFLNKGSELELDRSFPLERKMVLKGEAWFEVAPDPENPFRITAGNAEITVLGTSFNVKEAIERKQVEVYVQTGIVKLENEENPEGISLLPGQLGISDEGKLFTLPQTDLNYLSWKTHEFRFINEDLENILKSLENSYHVNILMDDEIPKNLKLSSTYSQQSVESIIATICEAFNLKYNQKADRYLLEKK